MILNLICFLFTTIKVSIEDLDQNGVGVAEKGINFV